MLTLQDIIDFCDTTPSEAETVADHQNIPLTFAAEMGKRLLSTPEGQLQLHGMMLDNMRHALESGQSERLVSLTRTFLDFQRSYPCFTPAAMSAA